MLILQMILDYAVLYISGNLGEIVDRYDFVSDFQIHSISERDVGGKSLSRKMVKFSGLGRFVIN